MEREEIIRNVNYIKEIIESSNRYTNISGLAGVICGVFALIGCVISYYLLGSFSFPQYYSSPEAYVSYTAKLYSFSVIWLVIFILAALIQVWFTVRKAHRVGIQPWTQLSRQIIFALTPSLLAGAALTVYLVKYNQSAFIPGLWILLYGVGVVSSGMFSIIAVRLLGWAFIFTSMIPLFMMPQYGLVFMALTFGLYHIIYGLAVAVKYRG